MIKEILKVGSKLHQQWDYENESVHEDGTHHRFIVYVAWDINFVHCGISHVLGALLYVQSFYEQFLNGMDYCVHHSLVKYCGYEFAYFNEIFLFADTDVVHVKQRNMSLQ